MIKERVVLPEVVIDRDRKLIIIDEREFRLSRKLRLLVECLAARPEHVKSWWQCADAMESDDVTPLAVRSAVKRARWVVGTRIKSAYDEGYYWKGPVRFIGGAK